jgi:hypothetical protein
MRQPEPNRIRPVSATFTAAAGRGRRQPDPKRIRPVSATAGETGRGGELPAALAECSEALVAETEVVIGRPFRVQPFFLSADSEADATTESRSREKSDRFSRHATAREETTENKSACFKIRAV